MEKLNKDLFKDPKLESKTKRTAGGPCLTAAGGGSVCITSTGGDLISDTAP